MLRGGLWAFAVTIITAPLVLAVLARQGVLDVPNGRSSHDSATPRGGGVAPALGVVFGVAVSSTLIGPPRVGLLVTAAAFGLLGLTDDIFGVSPLVRLGLQALAAALGLNWLLSDLSGPTGWQVLFAIGALVWLMAYVNAYNFMDGIDGIAVAQALIAGIAWWVIGSAHDVDALAAGGFIVAAAAAGFAPFNFPRARMFLGDVGSYFIGASVAALAVIGLRAGLPPEAVLAPLALFLADTGVTLVRRVARREPWYLPHCDHFYQRLVRIGWSHSRVTLSFAAATVGCSLLGACSLTGSVHVRVAADLALGALILAYLFGATTASAEPSVRPLRWRGERRRVATGHSPQ